jgi:predicted porin
MRRTRTRGTGKGFGRIAAWVSAALLPLLLPAMPAIAQQKTGPGITSDEALTWHGITLYGIIDIGLQYDTHGAPFSDYRPAASANIVQRNSRGSVFGATPSNMGQSRVGLQGLEPLGGEWSGVFRVETFFNPQSGDIADSLKSLTVNNGKTAATSGTNLDGSSAGQALQTAYVGVRSEHFGTLTFGRQLTLLTEGTVKYDPNYDASAFGLLGASGAYQGGGSTEDKRLDSMLKYVVKIADLGHAGVLYKFNGSTGSASTAVQADLGAEVGAAWVDGYYSKIRDAISASALSPAQAAKLPGLGYSISNSVAATVADTTTFALMGSYAIDPVKLFAGYEHIQYANPSTPLAAGFTDIGGYTLAFVTNDAYDEDKVLQVFWLGARYTVIPHLDVTGAYYGYHQNAYGTGSQAGCSTAAFSTCSGRFEAVSLDADYTFNQHLDAYLGAMYSGVHDGVASGYSFNTTNINPTLGVRLKF